MKNEILREVWMPKYQGHIRRLVGSIVSADCRKPKGVQRVAESGRGRGSVQGKQVLKARSSYCVNITVFRVTLSTH